jgi:hypothetical protein
MTRWLPVWLPPDTEDRKRASGNRPKTLLTCKKSSGARGTRTPDPLLAKQVLFQLSYSPEC